MPALPVGGRDEEVGSMGLAVALPVPVEKPPSPTPDWPVDGAPVEAPGLPVLVPPVPCANAAVDASISEAAKMTVRFFGRMKFSVFVTK